MQDFFQKSFLSSGTKGLVFIGNDVLIYRRDESTHNHPLELDIPGGRPKWKETPFDTFRRETKEEFDLDVSHEHILHAEKHTQPSLYGAYVWFVVAQLPQDAETRIKMGDEGTEYMLMRPEEYLARDDAWSRFQRYTMKYLGLRVSDQNIDQHE